jgi:hypothetical protein
MDPKLKYIPITALCMALNAYLPNAHADTQSGTPPHNKLPAAAAPPACVCTPTNGVNFVIVNCQCGNTQCITTIGGSGAGATSIACVK